MSKINKLLISLSCILAVALLLTVISCCFPTGQFIKPLIAGSVDAIPENQLKKFIETDHDPDYINLNLYKKNYSGYENGKVNVIIGFTGENARGMQRQAKLAKQKKLVEKFDGEFKKGYKIINAVSARLPLQAIENLSRRHEVSYIEPDYQVTVTSQEIPWGISRIFGNEEYFFPSWDFSTGQGVAVAVLDTGIDENHVDLPNFLGGTNTIDDTHWGLDKHGHGTHVAGTIAALNNSTGVVGVAPGADLYAVKVMDDNGRGSHSALISGIEWAVDQNIPIINMSLGGNNYSEALKEAVDAAYSEGILLVASAGNDGDSTDNVLYPAKFDSVIAVSASDINDNLAIFSSRGPSIELIAPGHNILSLYPGNMTKNYSGTSMASAHVAGSAAVIWGAVESFSNVEIRELLQENTQDLGLPNNYQGHGLVRVDLALVKALVMTGDIPPGSDSTISEIAIIGNKLIPEFSPNATDYKVYLESDVLSIEITAILSDQNATMLINGVSVESGKATTIDLEKTNPETTIEFLVTAADGKTEKTYIISVIRSNPIVQNHLFASFADAVYQSDGTVWEAEPVAHAPALALTVHEDKLHGAFGDGIYAYDGTSWGTDKIISEVASSLASYDGKLYGSFADATYVYDGTKWTLFTLPTYALVSYQDYLYASFSDAVYAYDGIDWIKTPIAHAPALALAVHDGKLYGAFEDGIYVYDGTSWDINKITPGVASNMASYDGKLYGCFADATYVYDSQEWSIFTWPTNALTTY